jgi:drug/metabolite transporter (DMT)-like permease
MSQRYLPSVLLLAAIWGASYLFIKVGVRDFQPSALMAARLVIAFVPLFAFLAVTRGGARRAAQELLSVWRPGLVLGLANAAVPFTLVAWGEKHIDSGETISGPVLVTATTLYGALLLLPWALVDLPTHAPGWKPVASLLALALTGTALAQLLLFHVLRLHGAAKLSLVTYLMPPFAVFYGATILGEPLRWSALGGLALILLGVALGSGVVGLRRRAELRTVP